MLNYLGKRSICLLSSNLSILCRRQQQILEEPFLASHRLRYPFQATEQAPGFSLPTLMRISKSQEGMVVFSFLLKKEALF
jgi:hypothetical protein